MNSKASPGRQHVKNALSARIGTLNVFLLSLVFILVAIAAVIIISRINADASKTISRSYAVEASETLHSFISRSLVVARIASGSKTIDDWYADENNQDKKRAAYHELINYAAVDENTYLRLCLSESKNIYLADARISMADFVPFAKLDPETPGDGWYDNCVNSENEYTLYIGIDAEADERQLIICHKIESGAKTTGVFSLGANIQPLFEGISALFESEAAGCIIDKQGDIIAGSYFPIAPGTSESAVIDDISNDPRLKSAAGKDLNPANGFFDIGAPRQTVKLSHGPYKYASIAPIAETNWSYAILFNNNLYAGATGSRNLIFLSVAILLIFILYALTFNALIRRAVFTPLRNLTHSVPRGGVIYGIGRDDELGALARRINGMHYSINAQATKVHEANEHLRHLLDSLPVPCYIWNKDHKIIESNPKALELYGFTEKYAFADHFFDHAPEHQANGQKSAEMMIEMLDKALTGESVTFNWRSQPPETAQTVLEITLVRVRSGNKHVVVAYSRGKKY